MENKLTKKKVFTLKYFTFKNISGEEVRVVTLSPLIAPLVLNKEYWSVSTLIKLFVRYY